MRKRQTFYCLLGKSRGTPNVLAAKNHDRAVLAGPGALAESYIKLARGFEELAATMEKLDLFPMPRAYHP